MVPTPVNIGRLLGRPVPGGEAGTCQVCGLATERGHPARFSDNFTQGSLLYAGDVICEYCLPLVKTPDFRRRSWVITPGAVRFGKLREIGRLVYDPPDPPFALYLTTAGKRYGFLGGDAVHAVATSRRVFPVLTDLTTGPVYVWADEAREMAALVRDLLAAGVPRKALMEGLRDMGSVDRLLRSGLPPGETVRRVRWYAQSPAWEIVCLTARAEDGHDG